MPGSRSSTEPRKGAPPPAISEKTLVEIELHLKRRETRRDELTERARQLRRQSQFVMHQLHQGRRLDEAIQDVRTGARQLTETLREEAGLDAGPVLAALQECVEAVLLDATFGGGELPGPGEIGVEPEPYLLGLGDLVGELRRRVLQELSAGDLPGAERLLALMEELTHALMRFEAPRSIVSLKPKQDTARALVERTRGDLTLARLLARAHLPPTSAEGG
ncbi:MAG TPA: haloacid dehalogenase [Thermoplasmata archaeon]|nr:haloacid dehalogenase [Thermoplasmata archaeon]